ncbi:MAG: PilZ domain-containing protein [Parasphingopyxis sp.]|uniref:PilZ domain-containing protein n=1 Tax=Parasphingopyxis sp. TaxID=1920299 RepID=UPI0032EF245F
MLANARKNCDWQTEFTVISLDGAMPQSADRRVGQRYMTVLQTGKLTGENGDELCLIRNISSGGAMLELFSDIDTGETVTIEFRMGLVVEAIVRWIEDGRCGVAFAAPIDVHQVLSPGGSRMAPRAPRLSVEGNAAIECEGERIGAARVIDISQGGVKVETDAELTEGQHIVMAIDGLPLRASTVCWSEDGMAGIAFSRTIPLGQVSAWAAGHQRHKQPILAGKASAT